MKTRIEHTRAWRFALAPGLLAATALSCAPIDEHVGQTTDEVALSTLRGRPGCTTAGAEALSAQLLDELLCLSAGRLVAVPSNPRITLTNPRVHAVMSPSARDGLVRAAATTALRINSAFRTIVEQWLLYTAAGCGLVATPGSSNHETGRAVDVDNYSAARSALMANGFVQSYPSADPVHFDGPGEDFRALSVRAFQRLWNANNPTDRIAEDGAWGPMTQSRLERSPIEGFRIGRVCGMTTMDPRLRAQFVMQSFPVASTPIDMTPGQELSGFIELRNTGTQTWMPGVTFLATTQPRDVASPLAHPSWPMNNRAASVTSAVAMGASARFAFTIRAPMTPGDYPQYFGMFHQGIGWFSDPTQGGPPDNQLQLRVRVGRPPFTAQVVRNTCETSVAIDAGATRECAIELRNTGAQAWTPGSTYLGSSEPREHESAFAHSSWASPRRVATVASTVATNATHTFMFTVRAPTTAGPAIEHLNLVDDTGGWFSDMANGGPMDDAIVLRLEVSGGSSGDGGTAMDASASDSGAEPTSDSGFDAGVPRRDAGTVPPAMGGCGCRTAPASPTENSPWIVRISSLIGAFALAARSFRRARRGARSRR
ncbi:MAG: D-alanyl-D-alanine carboxypeptidase family protein [Myxococcales bacterium]|nr:D-alanyl-D-alanine carboxypeptidase family protein [Myxococcales bacterium]